MHLILLSPKEKLFLVPAPSASSFLCSILFPQSEGEKRGSQDPGEVPY